MNESMNSSLKALHDQLLAERPEGAVHESESCPICAWTEGDGEETMTTFTEEEVTARIEAAVAAAVAERDGRIAELQGAVTTNETAQAVAAAVAERDAKITELQTALDEKEIEANNAATERDAIKSWLEAEATAAEERRQIDERRDDRLAKVKEVANFSDDYLEKNIERIAAMSEDDFAVTLDSWAALSDKKTPPTGDTIPAKTALHASRDGNTDRSPYSAAKELLAMRRERGHVDLTTL